MAIKKRSLRVPTRGRVPLAELGQAGDAGARAHYDDPAYYTKAYASRRSDVRLYIELAAEYGWPVLEFGVGNGRIALPLARTGIDVVGVDLSEPMLEDLARQLASEAESVQRRVRWQHGDMRSARVEREFPLVIAAFNTVLHLYEDGDIEAFLANVRQHLAPGGRFAFDWSVPRPSELARDPKRSFGAPPFRHPTRGRVRYRERFEYDPIRQVLLVEMQFHPERGAGWTVPLTHRQFFPREMDAWLHHAGLVVEHRFADFEREAPGPDVDSLVYVCRRAEDPPRAEPAG
jgi:SAM-dependent methyltransferase